MTGGRGPFVPLGEGPVEDDPFPSQPGSATIDDHGHTPGDSQASSMMAVSAPLIPAGPGTPPSCTPESTNFALQDAMNVDGDPQVALAMEHSRRERERLASRFANRPSSRGGQKCCR